MGLSQMKRYAAAFISILYPHMSAIAQNPVQPNPVQTNQVGGSNQVGSNPVPSNNPVRPTQVGPNQSRQNYILYLMQTGESAKALEAYQEYCRESESHDFDLLQQMGLILLDQGYRSHDAEIQMLTLFGAGVSLNEKALYILEEGLSHDVPQLQLIALNFLARYQNDRADEVLYRAMTSNHLLIRMEAAFHLAAKKTPNAVGQIESLMSKVHPDLIPHFPQFYGLIGDEASIKIMRKLLTHPDDSIRIETILSAAKHGRDDLLPQIRRMSSQHHDNQQEACAYALGVLKDEASISRLERLSHSHAPTVRLAALHSLYKLGRKDAHKGIEKMALGKDLYAIKLLGDIPEGRNTLAKLINDPNIQVRINAAIALLEHKDPRCLSPLSEVLFRDARDLLLLETNSQGKSLSHWKIASSAAQNFEDNPVVFELSLSLREDILEKALDLPEKDFIALANTLFETHQNDLIPLLTHLLENLQTQEAIELLKKHQQKVGAPLVRNYCNLALYRLKQSGPYEENLRSWVTQQQNVDLIRFRPFMPWELRDSHEAYFELTPQETSRLLVEAFESYMIAQDDKGIDVLISIMQNGNPKNKYALMGLLMRTTQ